MIIYNCIRLKFHIVKHFYVDKKKKTCKKPVKELVHIMSDLVMNNISLKSKKLFNYSRATFTIKINNFFNLKYGVDS